MNRMFAALLIEGKEPPVVRKIGDSVTLTFFKRDLNAPFRSFVAKEGKNGRLVSIDNLLIIQHLLQHHEIDAMTAAPLCQRSDKEIRKNLASMEQQGYIEHGGTVRSTYWAIQPALSNQLVATGQTEKHRRISWDAAKTRILSMLMERANRGEPSLAMLTFGKQPAITATKCN